VKKIVLVLAVAITLSVFASSQAAWAQSPNLSGDCAADMKNVIDSVNERLDGRLPSHYDTKLVRYTNDV